MSNLSLMMFLLATVGISYSLFLPGSQCPVNPLCRLVDGAYVGWDCTGTVSRCQGLCGAGCEEEAISSVDEDTGRIITFSGLTCTVTETRKTNITCTDGPREVWEAAECGCNLRAYFEDCV